MKVRFVQNPDQDEPEVVITARKLTPQIKELMGSLSGLLAGPVLAFHQEKAVLIEQESILRFFADGKGVSVQTDEGIFTVKQRLYEWEEMLDRHMFVHVSNSEIVNLKRVTALDLSMTGTIKMVLNETTNVYVSRRYMKKIKEAVGL